MDLLQLRNFKDFLQVYNQISEACFSRCVDNLNSRSLSKDESDCVDVCAKKHINVNHRVMGLYVEVQTEITNKRLAEAQAQERELKEREMEQSPIASNIPVTINIADHVTDSSLSVNAVTKDDEIAV